MRMNYIYYIMTYFSKHMKSMYIVFAALLSVSLALLLIGIRLRQLVDHGLSSSHINNIHYSVLLISILILIFVISSFLRSYFINIIALKVISQLKIDTFQALLKVRIDQYEDIKVGDIISRLSSDVESIGELIITFFSFLSRNLILFLGAVILMFMQSFKLSLIIVISLPIVLYPLFIISKRVKFSSRLVMDLRGDLAANMDEIFSGIRTIYAYNQQEYFINKFNNQMMIYCKYASHRLFLRSIFFSVSMLVIFLLITVVIWIGSMDIINNRISSGQIISFIYYATIVGMSAGGIAEVFSEIQGPLAALDRVLELHNINNILSSNEFNIIHTSNREYSIIFDQVSFSYPARVDSVILNNITLRIYPNTFIGIVGKSGSGKSTLVQLLLKFYPNYQGNICIGTRSLDTINSQEIRKSIAYVEQYPTIFSGTIRENITFSNPTANKSEITHVARLSGIMQFTDMLELGLDTEVGERGVRLSGGQKQRIGIARALLYKPEILILDEATSALDVDSEQNLLQNIQYLLKQKIIIFISHRISSIQHADKIFVLNQGNIVSFGNHSYLMKASNIYSLLYKNQRK